MKDLVPLPDRRPGLGPPRFGLGTLLLTVTAVCVVLASYNWLGAYGATLVGLFVIAVAAHVAGNWLGNQLRAIGDLPMGDEADADSPVVHGVAKGHIQPQHFAPASHLHSRAPLPRVVLLAVVLGLAVGACGGVWLVRFFSPQPPTWAMLVCGAAAFGVLAAIWSFLVVAFLQSGWKALSQAARQK